MFPGDRQPPCPNSTIWIRFESGALHRDPSERFESMGWSILVASTMVVDRCGVVPRFARLDPLRRVSSFLRSALWTVTPLHPPKDHSSRE